ncbi:MAG: hypothetical protein P8181_13555 [bacterium]
MTAENDKRSRRERLRSGMILTMALISVLTVLSCRDEPATTPPGRPVVERTSVHYMVPAVKAAHEGVVRAQEKLLSDPPNIDAAIESLTAARRSLANLEWFYLPATEARENVYNAYREEIAGNQGQRDVYLDLAKRGLLQVAERSSVQVEPYIKDLVDRIETVQFHIRDREPVNKELKSLCDTFQLHLLKAQLVLDENAFDEQERAVTNRPKEVDNVE